MSAGGPDAGAPAILWPYGASSPDLAERVANAKLLAVGAGGIGCELLKTLVMTGFKHIQVIDMDTIETSNLNRQFLFRKRHVGHSKAAVAAEAVKAMRPDIDITAHQGNVKEGRFDLDFFKSFDLVVNGLDNVDARRHVNRLCLAAGVPLVESGTAGYLGQVSVHIKGQTECYECSSKPTQKTYPTCTIRNTPDKLIHCVVWTKDLLFERLFGRQDAANDLDDAAAGEEGGEADADSAPPEVPPSFFLRQEGESPEAYAERIFGELFGDRIEALAGVKDMWHSRPPPQPLRLAQVLPRGWRGGGTANGTARVNGTANSNGAAAAAAAANGSSSDGAGSSACKALGLTDQHAVWDVQQNALVFLEAVCLFHKTRSDEIGSATFDKDDALAVEFVTAASNLRAHCYGIPRQSLFATKGMAGNIIHAIASTNAIVSGLIVLEALKLLSGNARAAAVTFINKDVSNKRLLSPMEAPPPRPGCMVCGVHQAHLRLNTSTTTLQQLVDKVLKQRLALVAPSLISGGFMYEEGEDLEEDERLFNARNLPKPLAELPSGGLRHGSVLSVRDQEQHFTLDLILSHVEEVDESQHPAGFELLGSLPQAQAEGAAAAPAAADGGAAETGNSGGGADASAPAAAAQQGAAAGTPAGGAGAGVALRETEEGVLELLDSEDEGPAGEAAAAAAALAGAGAGGRGKRKASGAEEEAGMGKRARVEAAAGAGAAAAEQEDGVIDLLSDDE